MTVAQKKQETEQQSPSFTAANLRSHATNLMFALRGRGQNPLSDKTAIERGILSGEFTDAELETHFNRVRKWVDEVRTQRDALTNAPPSVNIQLVPGRDFNGRAILGALGDGSNAAAVKALKDMVR